MSQAMRRRDASDLERPSFLFGGRARALSSEGHSMSRRCELTGIAVQSGNKVSHSNRKTRTRFLPNLVHVTLTSDLLERSVRLRVTAAALRSVEHRGGLDDFLVKAHESELSQDAVKLKREITKKRAEAKAEPTAAAAAA